MRYFFGMEPIANLDGKFTEAFLEHGLDVKKFTYSQSNPFYALEGYEVLQHNFQDILSKILPISHQIQTIDQILESKIKEQLTASIKYYIDNFDVFCFINCVSLLPCNLDYPILKEHGKKIISIFSGSEIRYPNFAKKMWKEAGFDFPDGIQSVKLHPEYQKNPFGALLLSQPYLQTLEKKRQHILMAELYADLVLSVPEMSGCQTSPYLPYIHMIDTKGITFRNNKRKEKPVVAHIPSNPMVKKSEFILRIINELKEENLPFEFRYFTGLPQSRVFEELRDCDILVDQMSLFPATIANEAMAAGCVTLTGNDIAGLPIPLNIFGCPAQNINPSNLKNVLRSMILNYELRDSLIEQGKVYIDTYCQLHQSVDRLFEAMKRSSDKDFDYFPSFAYQELKYDFDDFQSEYIRDLQFKVFKKNGLPSLDVLGALEKNSILSDKHKIELSKIPNIKLWNDQSFELVKYVNINKKYKDFFENTFQI